MWRGLMFGIVANLLFGGLAISVARAWLPEWWAQKPIRTVLKTVPVIGIGAVLAWYGSASAGSADAVWIASMIAGWATLMSLGLALALPISSLILRFARKPSEARPQDTPPPAPTLDTRPEPQITPEPEPDPTPAPEPPPVQSGITRRQLLHGAAGAAPVLITSTVTGGVAMGSKLAEIKPMTFSWAGLAPQLEGFKILHLSDIHIGAYIGLRQLRDLVEDAAAHKPDLVLVTGDLSDDLGRLPEALRLIDAVGATHGAYASIGNHEYYRGLGTVKRAHSRSDVPLLMETSTTLDIQGAKLCLAGADDPVNLRRDSDTFLKNTVQASLKNRPEDAFTIMMSHRPRGFVEAARQNVELTLSGHTHGGQVGFFGRSLFDRNENFFWGHYQNGDSQLYTSSGVGHWLPVRIGCPTEAPLITLSSKKA